MKYKKLEEVIQKQQAVIEEYENKIQSLSYENEKLHTLTDLQEANVNTMHEKTMELRKEIEQLNGKYRNLEINYNAVWEDFRKYEIENAELQKQVDELTDKLGKVLLGVKANELLVAKGIEKAVKNTAKKFADLVEFHSIACMNDGVEYFTISALGLKEILIEEFGFKYSELDGVEVE